MATNVFKGREAKLQVSTTSTVTSGASVGRLRNWQINASADPIDATSFDSSGKRELLDGIASYTGTCESLVLSTSATSQQDELRAALGAGTRKYLWLKNSTGAGSQTYKGWAYIAGWSQSGDLNDAQLHNFSWEYDGAVTEA